ncbi:hypothetical protein AWB71_01818 [Caballeronia peredens]|nr:hypothetical protein AWB71_01818 [Caballeronia peredens]
MKNLAAEAHAESASDELVELLASLEEIAHVEPLEEAARILNLACIAKGQPATFSVERLLKRAVHAKVRMSVALPEHFHVHRKNEAKPFADTPYRPMFPAGSDCLLLLPHAASEIYQARGSAVQLRRAACPAPDGTINSYVAAQPYPNISLVDLRIEREEIVRIIQEMPNAVNAIAVEPSGTALADSAPPVKSAVDVISATTSPTVRHSLKVRRNVLDTAIERAIEKAQNEKTADVFLVLRDMALNEVPPFTGTLEDGALMYTNEKGEVAPLSKGRLDGRLRRRRQASISVDKRR